MSLLSFDRVAIHLGGREILSPTSFDVARGEFVCIVGPSGCGKTTLLRAVAGLVSATAGEVRRNGEPVTQPSREVAFVFQDYGRSLFPWMKMSFPMPPLHHAHYLLDSMSDLCTTLLPPLPWCCSSSPPFFGCRQEKSAQQPSSSFSTFPSRVIALVFAAQRTARRDARRVFAVLRSPIRDVVSPR